MSAFRSVKSGAIAYFGINPFSTFFYSFWKFGAFGQKNDPKRAIKN